MSTPADIQKLIQRMERAKALADRAASTNKKGDQIMDRFEARLDHIDDHFSKVDAYEKQLAAMEGLDNGGPPLEGEFRQSNGPAVPPSEVQEEVRIDHATGDPIK